MTTKKEDYAKTLSNIDYVLDALGERELPKEFLIMKKDGKLVSLRGLPNGEFAIRSGMSPIKKIMLKLAGMKYGKMAAANNQNISLFLFMKMGQDWRRFQRSLRTLI